MKKATQKATPIPFSDKMVRAILDGSKKQTRRTVKVGNSYVGGRRMSAAGFGKLDLAQAVTCAALSSSQNQPPQLLVPDRSDCRALQCVEPIWQSGQRLWVREAWAVNDDLYKIMHVTHAIGRPSLSGPFYRADSKKENIKLAWRAAVQMPSWVSRLALEITNVRVQRIQGITAQDCLAEGVAGNGARSKKKDKKNQVRDLHELFRKHWENINGARAWEDNPWVWVFEFERVTSRGST